MNFEENLELERILSSWHRITEALESSVVINVRNDIGYCIGLVLILEKLNVEVGCLATEICVVF
jgi:hypothetical protein